MTMSMIGETLMFPVYAVHAVYDHCWKPVLLNGFAMDATEREQHRLAVTLAHFQPVNNWEIQHRMRRDRNTGEMVQCNYFDVVDLTTGDKYCGDTENMVRIKCLALLVLGTPIVHGIALVLNVINRVAKIVSGMYFWHESLQGIDLKDRFFEMGRDIVTVAATPLLFVGLMLASLYGAAIRPYDGRKLYATLERAFYYPQTDVIAPCFQPDMQRHFFNGDLETVNVW